MSDYGLAIAAGGKNMQSGEWKFDSRKKKWTVDLQANPSHVKLFEMNGGTKFVLNAGLTQSSEEVLFQMEHKMPWPPKFLCYFFYIDAPLGFADSIGYYSFSNASMLINNPGAGGEGLYAQVDNENFYIRHYAETYGIGSGNTTFYGSDYKFRVKFELLNQKAMFLGQKY